MGKSTVVVESLGNRWSGLLRFDADPVLAALAEDLVSGRSFFQRRAGPDRLRTPEMNLTSVVTKKVKLDDRNIREELYALWYEFKLNTGRQPLSFILGPEEFLKFCMERESMPGRIPTYLSERSFMGVEIRVSKNRGISLEIPADMAPYFAIGIIKEEKINE